MNASCEKQVCLSCNTYDLYSFNQNIVQYGNEFLNSFNDSIFLCETDDTWDDIVWATYQTTSSPSNSTNTNPTNFPVIISTENSGFSFIDLDIFTLGYRVIENNDIDNDGIINSLDSDIDNDGLSNNIDSSPYGIISTSTLELLICRE